MVVPQAFTAKSGVRAPRRVVKLPLLGDTKTWAHRPGRLDGGGGMFKLGAEEGREIQEINVEIHEFRTCEVQFRGEESQKSGKKRKIFPSSG